MITERVSLEASIAIVNVKCLFIKIAIKFSGEPYDPAADGLRGR